MEKKSLNTSMMKKDNNKQEFACIDILKLLFAFLVIALHIPPFRSYNPMANHLLSQGFCRLAVPFFFTATGFFLFRKMGREELNGKTIKIYILKILKLYLIWTMIYLPIIIYKISTSNDIIRETKNTIKYFFLTGSYVHLWYLPGTAVAVFMVYLCLKINMKNWQIFIFAFALYSIALLTNTYWGLIRDQQEFYYMKKALSDIIKFFINTRNGIFFGFIYIFIGMVLAQMQFKIRKNLAVIMFAISMVLFLLEVLIIRHFKLAVKYDVYLFLLPVTFFLFYLASHTVIKSKINFIFFRKLSSLMFFGHMMVAFIQYYTIKINDSFVRFIVIASITITISIIILKLSEREKFKWLKRIY